MASMRLEIDGANRGCRTIRLESNLSQMDQLLKMTIDPIEFMCQAAGVNSNCKNQLDDLLAKQMVQNMPKSGFDLLNGSSLVNDLQILPKGKLEIQSCVILMVYGFGISSYQSRNFSFRNLRKIKSRNLLD